MTTETKARVTRRRVRWSVIDNGDAGDGIRFTRDKVKKMVPTGEMLPFEVDLEQKMLYLRDHGQPDDFFVIEVDVQDTNSESVIDSRVSTIRNRISQLAAEQGWPFKTTSKGRKNNRRAYYTIPYEEDGRVFLIFVKQAAIDPKTAE